MWPSLASSLGVVPDAINEPAVKKRMQDQGLEVVASTPADFTAFQAKEYVRWRDLIKSRNIKAD